jgi:ADP-heptose:LPS heptosyltransferase
VRILVIGLSNLGDAVLTTPVIEALRARHPGAVFDLVSDRRACSIFSATPHIATIHLLHRPDGVPGILRLVRALRRHRYDLVVDLRTPFLPWLLRARRRVARIRIRPVGPHAVESHMAVLAPLQVAPPFPECRVYLDAVHRAQAEAHLAPFGARRWLALAPGANWPGKIWPAGHYAGLVDHLAGEFDALLLVGSAADQPAAAAIGARSPLPVLDVTGATTQLEAAALLARATAFVGNDSGLGHVAAALGVPTCTVFGPGRPWRYHPWGPRATYLVGPEEDLTRLAPAAVAAHLRAHLAALATAGLAADES